MDELVRWLGEQLDEDERIARAATDRQPYDEWDAVGAGDDDDAARSHWEVVKIARMSPTPAARSLAMHIAAHDPARVLREIDAKRQLLNDYAVTARIRDEAAARIKAAGDQPDSKDLDTWDRAQREAAILEGPVKLSALVYVDRHGYLEAWRP